jgi:hypothetical protein
MQTMRFIVCSRQRPNLSDDERQRLYAAAETFYTKMPADVKLEADFILADRTGSYSVLTVPDRETMDAIMAPFAGLVVAEIHPLLEGGP